MKCKIIIGSAGSGKYRRFCAEIVQIIDSRRINELLVLAPDYLSARTLPETLIELSHREAMMIPGVFTFDGLADLIIEFSDTKINKISELTAMSMLQSLIERKRKNSDFKYFDKSAGFKGFVRYAAKFIHGMKEAEIDPVVLAEQARQKGEDDGVSELAGIYLDYHQSLQEKGLYDRSGRLWQAHEFLDSDEICFPERYKILAIHGFTSFTFIQKRILEKIAGHLDEIIVSIAYEDDPERQTLYNETEQLLKFFGRFDSEVVTLLPRQAVNPLHFLERHLFRITDKEDITAVESDIDFPIELISAPDIRSETEAIAARVKDYLITGDYKPRDISIVFPALGDYIDQIKAVFTDAGIPFHLTEPEYLRDTPLGSYLSDYVRAAFQNFPRAGLKDLTVSGYFFRWFLGQREEKKEKDGLGDEDASSLIIHTALSLLEKSSVREGSGRWIEYFDKSLERDCDEMEKKVIEALSDFVKAGDELRRANSLKSAGKRLSKLIDNINGRGEALISERKTEAALKTLFSEEFEIVDRHCGAERGETLAERILFMIGSSSLNPGKRNETSVLISNPYHIRGLNPRILFFAGLNKGAFPVYKKQQDFPYYSKLTALDESYQARMPRMLVLAEDQMILFYNLLSAVSEKIHFSWIENDTENPSIFIDDIRDLFPGLSTTRELPFASSASPGRVYSQSRAHQGLNMRKPLRADSLHTQAWNAVGSDNNETEFVTTFQDKHEFFRKKASLENSRLRTGFFDEYDGRLSSSTAREIAGRFFRPEFQFSASMFEEYGKCPFKFFMSNILRIKSEEEKDDAVGSLYEGSFYHHALNKFFTSARDELTSKGEYDIASLAEYMYDLDELIESEIQSLSSTGKFLGGSYHEIEKTRIAGVLRRFLTFERKKLDARLPLHNELAFGSTSTRYEVDGESIEEPLKLTIEGESILITGAIDRFDSVPVAGPGEFAVLDYKSGKIAAPADITKGVAFQVQLYLFAADQFLRSHKREYETIEANYISIKKLNISPTLSFDGEKITNKNRDYAPVTRLFLGQYVKQMRRGVFQPIPNTKGACEYCVYKTVCRYDKKRIQAKLICEKEETDGS